MIVNGFFFFCFLCFPVSCNALISFEKIKVISKPYEVHMKLLVGRELPAWELLAQQVALTWLLRRGFAVGGHLTSRGPA